jgi:hypothetical protein
MPQDNDDSLSPTPVVGDGVVTVPVSCDEDKKMSLVDATVAQMLTTHTLNGAQITADGRSALAEFTRLDHIRASNTISFREATGVRHVTESGNNSTQANPRS